MEKAPRGGPQTLAQKSQAVLAADVCAGGHTQGSERYLRGWGVEDASFTCFDTGRGCLSDFADDAEVCGGNEVRSVCATGPRVGRNCR